jgi:hypothetical protein
MCVILEKNQSMFKLGHKGGVLKEWFPFNVLQNIENISMRHVMMTVLKAGKFAFLFSLKVKGEFIK